MDPLEDETPTVEQKVFANTSSSGSSSGGAGDSQSSLQQDEDDDDDDDLSPLGSANAAAGMEIPLGVSTKVASTSDLSASYHEIFDSQMPPESAKAAMQRDEDEAEAAAAAARREIQRDSVEDRLRGPAVPNCDHNTEATTQYLTSKLVQDSLRWQSDHHGGGSSSLPPSPMESPSRKGGGGARRKTVATGGGGEQHLAEEFR